MISVQSHIARRRDFMTLWNRRVRDVLTLMVGALLAASCASPSAHAARKGPGAITLNDRTVALTGGVNHSMIKVAQKRLLELDKQSNEPIWLIINSPGGSVDDGLILVDTMASVESPKHCLVESRAYSMAAIILTFCDARYVLPHGTIMLHEASYGTAGEDPSNRSRVDFIGRHLDRLHEELAKRLGMTMADYREKIRDGWWLLAKEAEKAGVVDAVVTSMAYEELPLQVTETKETITIKRTHHDVSPEAAKSIPKRR